MTDAERIAQLNSAVSQALAAQLKAEHEVERLRAYIARDEWAGYSYWDEFQEDACPTCHSAEVNGHTHDCELAAMLKPSDSTEGVVGSVPLAGGEV